MNTHDDQSTREYKLGIFGGRGVGKSALRIQFIQSIFIENCDPDLEDSYRKQCGVDNEAAIIDVLDIAGQEEYVALREQYMHNTEGFLLVYSITNRSSFEEISKLRQQILHVKDRSAFPMVIVANKSDLENERQVSSAEGQELANRWKCRFIESSARDRINVYEAFYDLIREIRKYRSIVVPVVIKPESGRDRAMSYVKSSRCLIS